MKIERHPAVITDDLPAIYAFIASDDQSAAERLLDAVDATFAVLAEHPESGVRFPKRTAILKGVRMLPVSGFNKYLIVYQIADNALRVLYVVHGARHLPRLFRRNPRL